MASNAIVRAVARDASEKRPLCFKVPEANMSKARSRALEFVEPIGLRVVVRKDEPKRQTKGGIALPDQSEIPTITGRIVTISQQVENDTNLPLRQYDKVLFHPKNAIPVDFEPDNQLFVVPVEDIVAVFRRESSDEKANKSAEE
jgi:chaperonin GroES